MVRTVGQSGKGDRIHAGMALQKLGDLLGISHVAFHTQAQRLDPEQGRKTVKRCLAAAHIAQDLHPRFEVSWLALQGQHTPSRDTTGPVR